MNETLYSCHIDWLTLTIVGGEGSPNLLGNQEGARVYASTALEVFSVSVSPSHLYAIRPVFGYNYGFADSETATQVHVGARLDKQGIMVVFSGTALTSRLDGRRVLELGLNAGWKPTRIDVAFDLQNSEVSVKDFYEEYNADNRGVSSRKTQLISSRSGDTFTIGARVSEKYIRIYDKAREQNIEGDWKRVEIELKGLAAIEYSRDIATTPGMASVLIAPLFSGMVNNIADIMQHIAGGYDAARPVGRPETNPNKLLWLKKSVIPTLVKLNMTDLVTYEKFQTELEKALKEAWEDFYRDKRA